MTQSSAIFASLPCSLQGVASGRKWEDRSRVLRRNLRRAFYKKTFILFLFLFSFGMAAAATAAEGKLCCGRCNNSFYCRRKCCKGMLKGEMEQMVFLAGNRCNKVPSTEMELRLPCEAGKTYSLLWVMEKADWLLGKRKVEFKGMFCSVCTLCDICAVIIKERVQGVDRILSTILMKKKISKDI